MKIDILLFQLAVVFLPGLIWAQLDASYAMKEKPGPAEFLIRAFMFGLVTYVGVYCWYEIGGYSFSLLETSDSESNIFLSKEFIDEISISVPLSFILAVSWIYAATYKWLTRFLQIIRATRKYGDEDVWDLAFNSPKMGSEYVHVRDFDKGIVYAGWVEAFSETGKLRELLLSDALIYDDSGEEDDDSGEETEIRLLYIARDKTDIHIEFPSTSPSGTGKDGSIRERWHKGVRKWKRILRIP